MNFRQWFWWSLWTQSDRIWSCGNFSNWLRLLKRATSSAAASVLEGLDQTLTLRALGIHGALYKALRSTNPLENLNGTVGYHTRNVKRWRNGLLIQRWVAMALSKAEKKFRRIRGCGEMKRQIVALDEHRRQLELDNEEAVA